VPRDRDVVQVRGLDGKPLFLLEESVGRVAAVALDDSGRVVAERVTGPAQLATKLATKAASWMTERAVLMDLGQSDVAVAATQAEFGIPTLDCVADLASPLHFITHDRGVQYEEDAANAIEQDLPEESVSGGYGFLDSTWNSTSFVSTPYALGIKLSRPVLNNADWDLKARSLKRLVEKLRFMREIRVAKLLTTAGSYASGNQIAAGVKWNGGTNTSPITDVFAALAASYLPATLLILPEVLEPFFYNGPQGTATTSIRDLVQAGGVLPRIAIARAKKMVSGAVQYVWAPSKPSGVALVRSTPDDPDKLMTSRTYRWIGQGGDAENVQGMLVRFFEVKEDNAFYLVVSHNDYEAIVDSHVGAVITGAYA
jgi:hypothetical protein